MRHFVFSAMALLALVAGAARATTITFSGIAGANGTPMPNPYVESNFSVAPDAGTWDDAQNFGNPVPDIFGISPTGIIDVTYTADAPFTFTSVDLADAEAGGTNPTATYTIQGFLLGSQVFTTSGGPLGQSTFTTVTNPSPAQQIDLLRISMFQGFATYNIDNIVVTPAVPEPASIGALSIGALAAFRRPKKH